MKRMMKNTMKKVLCFTLLAILIIANTTTVFTMAATLNSRLPIYCYTLNGKVNTYSSVGGNRTGSIYTSDKCTILAVYDSGWIKVKYPVSWGSRTAYAKTSDFFCNSQMNVETAKLGKQMTVYCRSDASQSFGTVYASDEVVIIGNNGTNTQIIYNVSGGYKLGWVKGVYTNKVNSGFSIMNTTNLITTTTTTTKEKSSALSVIRLLLSTFMYTIYVSGCKGSCVISSGVTEPPVQELINKPPEVTPVPSSVIVILYANSLLSLTLSM